MNATIFGYRVRFTERRGMTIATCQGYVGTAYGSGEDAKHDALEAVEATVRRFAAMGDGFAATMLESSGAAA